MPTQLLAVAAGAGTSSDVTLAAGVNTSVSLKDAAGPYVNSRARVFLEAKDDAGQYFVFKELTAAEQGCIVHGPVTFRARREENGESVGAFQG